MVLATMLLVDFHTKKRKLEEMEGKSCDRSFGEKRKDSRSNVSRPLTPDMFEEDFPSVPETMSYPDVALQIEDDLEIEESASPPSVASWRGTAMSELKNRYSPGLPPVQASANHAVLFQLPVSPGCPFKPYPHVSKDRWDSLHVRMPSSSLSLYPVENAGKDGEEKQLRPRWELVQEALLRPITSSKQLQDAIFSYNSKYSERWDFSTLDTFFSQVEEDSRDAKPEEYLREAKSGKDSREAKTGEDSREVKTGKESRETKSEVNSKILGTRESTKFFSTLLPQIIGLALQLPSLVTGPIPLLVQNRNQSVSLTQLQVASLLANAFLCTFPRRNTAKRFSEYYKYPDINFNRLFHSSQKRFSCCIEKLRCLIHYFHRVCTKSPVGVLTYSRQYLSPSQLPDWTISKKFLPHLHISSSGTIEKEGDGFLQVDFANKMVGGGVLGSGCVQEEIRFIICPELIVSRLFTEELNSTEALIVTGCERYSNYVGYGDTFEWLGDYLDTTPRDSSGRRLCTVAAIDALNLSSVTAQFAPNCLRRELNKAYTGFLGMGLSADKLSPVATGNWGCGAFRGELWHMLVQYNELKYKEAKLTKELYPYLHQTVKYLSSTSRHIETLSKPAQHNQPSHSQPTKLGANSPDSVPSLLVLALTSPVSHLHLT
uniref:poly(ADP-ribose) glycohydrolase n=1 Tax=Timema tahoe TaxID=61484 RepID=A0A7R9II23_9NEOP|nr:unnamed protein product [Timema tahoe]